MCQDCLKTLLKEEQFVTEQTKFLTAQKDKGSLSAEVLLHKLRSVSKGIEIRKNEILMELN